MGARVYGYAHGHSGEMSILGRRVVGAEDGSPLRTSEFRERRPQRYSPLSVCVMRSAFELVMAQWSAFELVMAH